MNFDPGEWAGLLGLVFQAVKAMPLNKAHRTKDDEKALLALSDAYHSTMAFYQGNSDDPEREKITIAKKWANIGILLRKYDAKLAQRLDLKSRFWREGATWDDQSIKNARIGLNDIWTEVNVKLKRF